MIKLKEDVQVETPEGEFVSAPIKEDLIAMQDLINTVLCDLINDVVSKLGY